MFGSKLHLLRKSKGLTRNQLAEALGISPNTIKSYESGTREPNHKMTKKIAKFFGVTTDFILEASEVYEDEKDLIITAAGLSPEDKKRIIEIIKTFK